MGCNQYCLTDEGMRTWMVPMTSFPISPRDLMDCPNCNSEKTNIINMNYPKTFECASCGHVFMESKKSLIDE